LFKHFIEHYYEFHDVELSTWFLVIMYAVHVNLNRNRERLLRKCVHRVRELKHTAKLYVVAW